MLYQSLFVMVASMFVASVFAAEPAKTSTPDTPAHKVEAKAVSVWKSQAELGYVKTTGNTKTESTNFKARVENEREFWDHSARIESIRNSDSSGTTAERYLAAAKTKYKYTTYSYIFGRLQYEDDRFSGYDYQASLIAGYGHSIIKHDKMKWDAEVGAGIRENELEDGTSQSEGLLFLGTQFEWKISPSAHFSEEIDLEAGEDRTITKSVTALSTKINSKLQSKITYTVKHNNDVPVGKEKTDTETAISLVYTF